MSWVSGGQLVVIQTGGLVAGTAGGQAAHHHNLLHAQQLRQTEGFLRHLPVLLEGKGVAGAVQGAQGDIPAVKLVHPALPGRLGVKQFIQVDMGRAGPVAGVDLHRLNALRHAEIQHGRKGHIQCAGFDRKPHRGPPWSLIFLGGRRGAAHEDRFFSRGVEGRYSLVNHRSRSTGPSMPSTTPLSLYCQRVTPRSSAGTGP